MALLCEGSNRESSGTTIGMKVPNVLRAKVLAIASSYGLTYTKAMLVCVALGADTLSKHSKHYAEDGGV